MKRKKKGKRVPSAAASEAAPPPAPLSVAPRPPRRCKKEKYDWRAGIGCRIACDEYVKPDGSVYFNYTIECTRHDDCVKTYGRSPTNILQHGEIGVIAFLHAWLTTDAELGKDGVLKSHRATNPSRVDVAAFVKNNTGELERLFTMLTGE